MATIRIPVPLRELTGGSAHVTIDGTTAGELIDGLVAAHPAIGSKLLDDGDELTTSTYESINFVIGRSDIRELAGRATPVRDGDKVMLLRTWPAAISGGRQWNQPVGAEPPE